MYSLLKITILLSYIASKQLQQWLVTFAFCCCYLRHLQEKTTSECVLIVNYFDVSWYQFTAVLCVRIEMVVVAMENVCQVCVSVTQDTLEHAVRQVSKVSIKKISKTNLAWCRDDLMNALADRNTQTRSAMHTVICVPYIPWPHYSTTMPTYSSGSMVVE